VTSSGTAFGLTDFGPTFGLFLSTLLFSTCMSWADREVDGLTPPRTPAWGMLKVPWAMPPPPWAATLPDKVSFVKLALLLVTNMPPPDPAEASLALTVLPLIPSCPAPRKIPPPPFPAVFPWIVLSVIVTSAGPKSPLEEVIPAKRPPPARLAELFVTMADLRMVVPNVPIPPAKSALLFVNLVPLMATTPPEMTPRPPATDVSPDNGSAIAVLPLTAPPFIVRVPVSTMPPAFFP
jgi:hypothetical protein